MSTAIWIIVGICVPIHIYKRYYFPRDPKREINGGAVISPADGRVIYVNEVQDGVVPISIKGRSSIPLVDIVKGHDDLKAGVLIGIYLSPFDVHYQRSPIEGRVVAVNYHQARRNHLMTSMFLRYVRGIQPMYSESPHICENERNIVHIKSETAEAYVVQIADKVVRNIDCYVAVGDQVAKGQKLGMIRTGSQVDLFLPGAKIADLTNLSLGDKVIAGETAFVL